jgi:RNA polymerase sigma-70 factor (ECF subfamily)
MDVHLAAETQGFDLLALVGAHQEEVWRYLRYLGCDPAGADELTQDTFLAVHARPFEIRSPAMTRSYLRKVARNLFLKEKRRILQRPRFVNLDEADRCWEQTGAEEAGGDYREALRSCMAELGERPRQVLQLAYGEGLPRREVAKRLAMRDQGVKTLLRRVKDRLKECIDRRLRS